MLIIALVLALIGLVALVFAVVTSNELVAWVCIGASVLGVVLLIVDALRERQRRDAGEESRCRRRDRGRRGHLRRLPGRSPGRGRTRRHRESAEDAGAEAGEESAVRAEGHGDDSAK